MNEDNITLEEAYNAGYQSQFTDDSPYQDQLLTEKWNEGQHDRSAKEPMQSELFDKHYGTPAKKLARRDSPDTSIESAQKVDSTRLEREVFNIIKSFGEEGCISDDVRFHPSMEGKPYSSVTARYRALLDKGFIVDTGQRRKGRSGRGMRVMKAQA